MILYDHRIEEGHILSLTTLRARLERISFGAHQWTALLVPYPLADRHGQHHTYVAIGYSNPDIPHMPNMLCYLFPIVAGSEEHGDPLICLHPTSAIPLTRGLYFEGDHLGADILEDWNRFWEPLAATLTP